MAKWDAASVSGVVLGVIGVGVSLVGAFAQSLGIPELATVIFGWVGVALVVIAVLLGIVWWVKSRSSRDAAVLAPGSPHEDDDRRRAASSRVTILRNWPSERTMKQLVSEGLLSLPDQAFPLLDIMAMNVVDAYERNAPEGRVIDGPPHHDAALALEQGGYLVFENAHCVLTNKGLLAASLIASHDPIPAHIEASWPQLRAVRARSKH